MKQVHDMTPEELQNLLAFPTQSGEMYFYSNIQRISKSAMLYNGTSFELTEEQYEKIMIGLNNYEAYKLLTSRQEAEELLKEKAETVLIDYYKDRLDSILLPLETTISTLIEGAKITFSRVQLSHETLNATASSLSKYAEKIDKFVESTDLHTAEYRLRRKVNELSNVKDEVLSALQPITKEANSILGTLKTIISED